MGREMTAFSQEEIEYLEGQLLGRLATAGPGGKPHVVPVGFRVNPDAGTIEIGGHGFGRSWKFRQLRGNPNAAFVVDDLASTRPWRPRGVEVRGTARLHSEGGEHFGPGWDAAWLEIVPERIRSWGLGATA